VSSHKLFPECRNSDGDRAKIDDLYGGGSKKKVTSGGGGVVGGGSKASLDQNGKLIWD
jgi:hypothetical protein